jgi:heme/copper-type cytochrome/quinol oxidase subunit 3
MISLFRQNAMNLRNVTIWTTGVILTATFTVPFVCLCADEYKHLHLAGFGLAHYMLELIHRLFVIVLCSVIACLFTGLQLIISLMIARKLTNAISVFILLVSTILPQENDPLGSGWNGK